MIPWIFAVLALWVVQTMLPNSIRYLTQPDLRASLQDALGGRDVPPEQAVLGARAARAQGNLQEALPVFLTLALLLELQGAAPILAVRGALIFFLARVAYVPAYLSAIPGVRSAIWGISWIGLAMMIAAVWGV